MAELKYKEITEKIIGAAMKVHSKLGNGFQEVIYQRAMAVQMEDDFVGFQREFNMPIFYNGRQIGERRVDFLVAEIISVELKAITKLEPVHFAQARNYLEAYNLEIGLLINFGTVSLEFKRLENPKYVAKSFPQNQQILPNPRSDDLGI